jgi:chain length determinant protein EpsF
MNYQQLIRILSARRRTVLDIFGVIIVLVVALTLILPKQYTAVASVVIDAKIDPVAGGMVTDQLLSAYVATQEDVINSERVAQRVVKALKLDQMPSLQEKWKTQTDGEGDITIWIARLLIDKVIRVLPAHESLTHPGNVINIAAKWPDPHIAAMIANAFAQAAIETNIELKIEPAKQYARWFDARSQILRSNLQAKQKALSDFQNDTGITATDQKLDVETARLTELSSELVAIQGQRQDSQSRQRQVSGNNESLPEVMQSPVITNLKNNLSEAEGKRSDIDARLGKNHPDYQAAEAEVEALHQRIAQETAKIAASLGSTAQVDLRRENNIGLALEAQKKRVLELKHQHDQLDVLSSDVATAQRDLDAVTQRFAESSLESQIQQTNVVLLTTAAEPIDPSSPKFLINLLVGIFIGTVCGIGAAVFLESRNPLVRSEADLVQLLGVPLLGHIGSLKLSKLRNLPGTAHIASVPRIDPSVA